MKDIHPLLDAEKQRQARQYEKEKRYLGVARSIFSLLLLLGFYFSGLSSWAAYLFPEERFLWIFLLYGALFFGVLGVLGLPLSFYSGYIHEHKWNFSNQTLKSWFWEQTKSFIVSLLIFYMVLALLLLIMSRFAQYWWLIAGMVMALVGVVFTTLFPVLILPIFNTYTPIENEELIDCLDRILTQGGLKSSGFFMEDMSRQTKKENAFLAGLGKTRRVVLADNLLNNMSVGEIESIIAHEVGHYRHRHLWKNMGIGFFQQVLVFFVLHLTMQRLFPDFLSSARANLALLPIFALVIGFLSGFLFAPLGNALSRHFERQADTYALDTIGDGTNFQSALAGLADRNLSNAYPLWWVKYLYYSHPPIGERLESADCYGAANVSSN